MRRWSALIGLVFAAALLAWRGAGKPLPGHPRAAPVASRLVIGVRADVTSLNIYTAASAFDQEIADLLYPRLAYEEDDFQQGPPTFRPGLASSWSFPTTAPDSPSTSIRGRHGAMAGR